MNKDLYELIEKWRKRAIYHHERLKDHTRDYRIGLAEARNDCADELENYLTTHSSRATGTKANQYTPRQIARRIKRTGERIILDK